MEIKAVKLLESTGQSNCRQPVRVIVVQYQTTYAAFAAGSLCSAATAYNARRRAIAPAAGHARLSSLPSAGPPTAALPPKPPAPSALSSQLPAPALAVLETGGHSHLTYRLSVTRECPPLGLVSLPRNSYTLLVVAQTNTLR